MANTERVRGNDIGPTGITVGENISRVRKSQQISLQALEARLSEIGRKISLSGLSKIENGDRRVDTDDLMAIAIALDVTPLGLLLPIDEPGAVVDVTGARGSVGAFWGWAMGDGPHFTRDGRAFMARSFPWWLDQDGSIDWYGELELVLGVDGEEPKTVRRITYAAQTPEEVNWRSGIDGVDQAAP